MGKCFNLTLEQKDKVRLAMLGSHASPIIVWDSELEDVGAVVKKVKTFTQCRTCQSRASKSRNTLGKCRDFIRSIPIGDKEKVQS